MCAAITCSSGMKPPPSGNLERSGARAERLHAGEPAGPRSLGSRTTTARLSERSRDVGERVGPGRAASGVSTGYTRSSNTSLSSSALGFFLQIAPVRDLGRRLPQVVGRPRSVKYRGLTVDGASVSAGGSRRAGPWDDIPSADVPRNTRHGLLFQPCDPDLEELIDVLAEDGEKLCSLERRPRVVLCEREHARTEVEPRQLTIQEARVSHQLRPCLARMGLAVELSGRLGFRRLAFRSDRPLHSGHGSAGARNARLRFMWPARHAGASRPSRRPGRRRSPRSRRPLPPSSLPPRRA